MKKYMLSLVAGSALGLGFALMQNGESNALVNKSLPIQDTKYVASCSKCNANLANPGPFTGVAPVKPLRSSFPNTPAGTTAFNAAMSQYNIALAKYNGDKLMHDFLVTRYNAYISHRTSHVR
jgi:hypothetical protein